MIYHKDTDYNKDPFYSHPRDDIESLCNWAMYYIAINADRHNYTTEDGTSSHMLIFKKIQYTMSKIGEYEVRI